MTVNLQEMRVQDLCLAEVRALQHVAVTELRKKEIGVSHGILKGENLLIFPLEVTKHLQLVLNTFIL